MTCDINVTFSLFLYLYSFYLNIILLGNMNKFNYQNYKVNNNCKGIYFCEKNICFKYMLKKSNAMKKNITTK